MRRLSRVTDLQNQRGASPETQVEGSIGRLGVSIGLGRFNQSHCLVADVEAELVEEVLQRNGSRLLSGRASPTATRYWPVHLT